MAKQLTASVKLLCIVAGLYSVEAGSAQERIEGGRGQPAPRSTNTTLDRQIGSPPPPPGPLVVPLRTNSGRLLLPIPQTMSEDGGATSNHGSNVMPVRPQLPIDSSAGGLMMMVARTERQLADPTLEPFQRSRLESLLAIQKDQLAAQQQSQILWNNLIQAKISKDPSQKAQAEKELANFLNVRLEKISGKPHPGSRDLAAVLKDYKELPGVVNKSRGRGLRTKIVAVVLIALLCIPLGFYLFRKFRLKST